MDSIADTDPVVVAALYRFARFDDPDALRGPLLDLCVEQGVRGTLLLAHEGINGTIAGSGEAIESVEAHIRALPDCRGLNVKYSAAPRQPFRRMKVRVKPEIVTMGVRPIDAGSGAGTHVDPQHWNALISDPDTILVDTRNAYEVAIGSFPGAIDPGTGSFRDFPAWFDAAAEQWRAEGRKPKLAMFCTGGIRCEKSTAYARAQGFDEVYHLKGGILRYLEEIPEAHSLWRGDCFVFDERVAITHGLEVGDHELCRRCGQPVERGQMEAHAAACGAAAA